MTAQETQTKNAEATAAAVALVVGAYGAGKLNDEQAVGLTVTTVLRGTARAIAIADTAAAAWVTSKTGLPVTAHGLLPDVGTRPRLRSAVVTILGDDGNTPARLERLATAEPLESGRRAATQAYLRWGVEGWRRKTDANACQSCTALAEANEVYDMAEEMFSHPRCGCVKEPVASTTWADELDQLWFQQRFITPAGIRFSSGVRFERTAP